VDLRDLTSATTHQLERNNCLGGGGYRGNEDDVRRVLELGICVPQELRPWDATVGIRVGVSAWGENTDSHCEQ
jgi:hypothetical protein